MQLPPALLKSSRPVSIIGVGLSFVLLTLITAMLATLIGVVPFSRWVEISVAPQHTRLLLSASFQAFCSASLSVLFGLLCARAVYRQNITRLSHFLGAISFMAMILPTTVAALALLSVWGRNGILRNGLSDFGIEGVLFPAYGLEMVILAHVFFNAPLALRVMLGALYAIPPAQSRMAAQLGFNSIHYWRWIEWPALRTTIPSLFGLIFLLCFSSFSLVLMLGGGPDVSTLEVAIYTSLRFAFDLPTAGVLASLQLLFSVVVILCISRFKSVHWAVSLSPHPAPPRADRHRLRTQITDISLISAFIFFIVFPISYLVIRTDYITGVKLFTRPAFWQALHGSVSIALASALLSVSIVCLLSTAYYRLGERITPSLPASAFAHISRQLILLSVSVTLVLPSIVLGTVSFLWLRSVFDMFAMAFWIVLGANCLLALPFAWRILGARYQAVLAATDQQCYQLNLRGWRRFWHITFPSLKREFALALGLTAALSVGDFGVIALFGSDAFRTLPWLLYQYASRYGGAEAELLSFVLLMLCLGFYGLFKGMITLLTMRGAHAYRRKA